MTPSHSIASRANVSCVETPSAGALSVQGLGPTLGEVMRVTDRAQVESIPWRVVVEEYRESWQAAARRRQTGDDGTYVRNRVGLPDFPEHAAAR